MGADIADKRESMAKDAVGGAGPSDGPVAQPMALPSLMAPALSSALLSALVQQAVILVLAGMILDGGAIAQMCFYALLGYWVAIIMLLRRRRLAPTRGDLIAVRGGFLPLCVFSVFLTQAIWHWRGF